MFILRNTSFESQPHIYWDCIQDKPVCSCSSLADVAAPLPWHFSCPGYRQVHGPMKPATIWWVQPPFDGCRHHLDQLTTGAGCKHTGGTREGFQINWRRHEILAYLIPKRKKQALCSLCDWALLWSWNFCNGKGSITRLTPMWFFIHYFIPLHTKLTFR